MAEKKKWHTLLVRLTPDQHKKLERLAEHYDRSMSATVRRFIDNATEPK